MESIQQAAEFVLDKVKQSNATADVIVNEGESLSLKANQGELEEHKVSSSQILGLRVIKDNRTGAAYSESFDENSLNRLVDQALTNAHYAAEDEHQQIQAYSHSLKTDDTLLCPADDTQDDTKIEMALSLEQALIDKPEISSVPYNGISESVSRYHGFSSHGLNIQSQSRTVMAYGYALATRDDKNAMEGAGRIARVFSDLNLDDIVDEAYQNCLSMLDGTPIESGHYDVIFDRECHPQLWGVFDMVLSGKSAKDGINPWREKVNSTVASSQLTLRDNPSNTDGFGYTICDSEGTPAKDTILIENGKLATLLHNSATASFFDTQTTGHASHGPKHDLTVYSHQLMMDAGNDNESVVKAGKTIEITDMTGLHSGADPISGDFSFGASGYLCQDGIRQRPLRGITVAGNFYSMLNKIESIGDTQYWNWQKDTCMPLVRYSGLTISGE